MEALKPRRRQGVGEELSGPLLDCGVKLRCLRGVDVLRLREVAREQGRLCSDHSKYPKSVVLSRFF